MPQGSNKGPFTESFAQKMEVAVDQHIAEGVKRERQQAERKKLAAEATERERQEAVAPQEELMPNPPDEPSRRRVSPRKGRKYREHYYQGKHITLENYKKLVDKLIPESHKLVTPEELLKELNINKNDEIPEIYQDILDNNIDNYDTAYIKLIENIRMFLENKKELDEI